jgi:FAD/FMN-containing dehydrogenase
MSVMLETKTTDAFKARLRGPLLLPGDAGYDDGRSVWNAMIDRRPAAIVRCLGAADVIASVAFGREQGLPISIKGGGHNISGLAVAEGGLMLDMSLMRGVWVDPAARTARAQAGCLLGDVDRETQVHGLAAALGFVSNTGIAGLTLGGGFGYLTRQFGWTGDTVRSIEMVTAQGRIVHASDRDNADLLWALRGGGGNFGVVTNFEYALHAVGPEIVGGAVAWRGETAREVLEMYRTLCRNAPRNLTCVVALRPAPPAPWLSKEAHGKLIALMLLCHSGPIEEGEKLAAPVKGFGAPVGDILQRRPYVTQQSLLDATQPKGRRYYWKSEYVADLSDALLDQMVEQAKRIVSPHSAVILFQLGGAIADLPADFSATGNRDAASVLNITAAWDSAKDDEANIGWARTAWQDMRRFSTGGTYINFLTEEEAGDRIRAAYGKNYARLAEAKMKWDPENVFRVNKNIAPVVEA